MLSKAQIKHIQSLQHKKYRQKYRQYMAEGDKIVQELLQAGLVQQVYATADWLEEQGPLPATITAAQLHVVAPQELRQLSALTTPNRAMALLPIPPAKETGDLSGTIALALETIQDPGNLGTIIRIADWFGIPQVICSPDCVDAYNPKTIQATMGSIARVQVTERDISTLLQQARVPAYAATLHGRSLAEFSTIREGIILIGNESRGLSAAVLERSAHRITIPRLGGAESLNAAVATGIICSKLLI
jgi:TrmH family RNA methyltransferase